METVCFLVTEAEAGTRIDVLLAERAGISRAAVQRLIDRGAVTVGSEPATKNHKVKAGEIIFYIPPEPEPARPEPRPIPLDIRFEDAHLLVLSKPAGLVVHPAAGHREDTLVNALLHRYPGLASGEDGMRPGIVHRLDKLTSGLMLVARSEEARDKLIELIRDRQVHREYIALVYGVFPSREGTIEAPIGRDPRNRKKMAVTNSGGRAAVTHFRVVESFPGASLLEVGLDTGRTHQIRVHLAFIGHPVVGDRMYGRRGEWEALTGLDRQFLHSHRLTLPHPVTGKLLEFADPLPEELQAALDRLRGAAPPL